VTARARDLLRPPATVTLGYDNGVLTASGEASARWLAESGRIAPAIAGVRRFAYNGPAPEVLLKNQLESTAMLFSKGDARIPSGQLPSIRRVGLLLAELNDALRANDRRAAVELLGYTDSDGTASGNGPLSQARADAVLAALPTERFEALDITSRGGGSMSATGSAVSSEAEKERNRRVSVRVVLPDGAAPGGRRP
jgi:outer membrane protein OmpA-like peptidoglycan-associated protein